MEGKYVWLCGIVVLLECISGQTLNDAKSLQTDLFNGYTKGVIPVLNQSEPLLISVVFFLKTVNSFDEVDETVSITAGISLNWTDPSLMWNPLAYGNLSSTIIDSGEIWTPPVFLVNSVDALESVGNGRNFYTTLFATGEVVYTPGGVMNAKCPTDIAKFPFDSQTCLLQIGPWGIANTHLIFDTVYDEARLEFFTPHSDWTLSENKIDVGILHGYSMVTVTLSIKRQPLYYGVMVIMPTLLFSLLNPLAFLLPVESGERVSFAMTILLSYAIFLTLVSGSIPTTSNPMCVLLIVMIAIIAVSGIIVVGAIVSAKFYYQKDDVKHGPFTTWLISCLQKRGNKVEQMDDKKEQITNGKSVSCFLDTLLFYGTYAAIIVTMACYFLYATI